MKVCKVCEKAKPRTEFYAHPYSADRLQGNCRDCQRERQNAQNKRIKAALVAIKAAAGCARCPENNPACLDFHHRDPAEKSLTLSKPSSASMRRIMEEVAKCIVLCANCHRKLHAGVA